MKRTYEGWDTNYSEKQKIILDWLCRVCKSPNMFISDSPKRPMAICTEGNITTDDDFSIWTCKNCKTSDRGHRMIRLESSREIIEIKQIKKAR